MWLSPVSVRSLSLLKTWREGVGRRIKINHSLACLSLALVNFFSFISDVFLPDPWVLGELLCSNFSEYSIYFPIFKSLHSLSPSWNAFSTLPFCLLTFQDLSEIWPEVGLFPFTIISNIYNITWVALINEQVFLLETGHLMNGIMPCLLL